MTWQDKDFSSSRPDGAKVGAFWPEGMAGRMVWWGYDASGNPTGPFETMTEAKAAVDAALFPA